MRRLNFLEDEPWDEVNDRFRLRRRWFGHPFGTDMLGASLTELLPGSPEDYLHMHYGVEEMFFVLSGTPTVRTPAGEEQLATGEVVYFPEGRDGLHSFSNPTDESVRILGISTKRFPDVVAYPEQGVAWVATRHPERRVPQGGDEGIIARFDLPSRRLLRDFDARHGAWHDRVVELAVVELGPDTIVEGRPFTAPARSDEDASVMRDMLVQLRGFARGWAASEPAGEGVLVRRRDAAGLRTWTRVPDRDALLAAGELTTVGFFGQARAEVDHAPIHRLEEAIVDTLEQVPGVLCYFDLELPDGRYGNLILCSAPDVPVRWHAHELHRDAVELAPRHYHSARLHRGIVRSPLLGDHDLIVLRTHYHDFDSTPTWLAVRQLGASGEPRS